MTVSRPIVVIDTNVFVAAGFNPKSSSGWILEQVRDDRLRLVWNEETRRETLHILSKIPHLSREKIAPLFRAEHFLEAATHPERFNYIGDPDDRKFAALAEVASAVLITSDDDLLSQRHQTQLDILTPSEFCKQFRR